MLDTSIGQYGGIGRARNGNTLFLIEETKGALQELQSVIAERNSLQQHLAEVTAQKEAEIRQLHEDRAALQV